MGNICGKQESDSFTGPGRRLGSAPAPSASTAPVPASATVKTRKPVGGPPRTLGGGAPTPGAGAAAGAGAEAEDPRSKAAAAAEARAQGAAKGGKLQAQLKAQKKLTMAATLKEASETERRVRDLDASNDALAHR